MKLPSLSALSVKVVTEEEPWAQTFAKVPAPANKAAYRAWSMDPNTQWFFFSGYVGESVTERVSVHNQAAELRAFVADYDMNFSDEEIQKIKTRLTKSRFRPTVLHRTFSGGLRLVFMLEQPVSVDQRLSDALQLKAAAELGLNKIAPGFDKDAFKRPEQYYAFWHEGVTVTSGDVVSLNSVLAWKADCLDKISYKAEAKEVGLDLVEAEVAKRFPGRWDGPIQLGARGLRFWDPTADNTSAAVVCENGMKCFTGPTPFMSWGSIFGASFVADFTQNRFGEAVKDCYSDGMNFWGKVAGGWSKIGTPNMYLYLKAQGLDTEVIKGEAMSELERALAFVNEQQQIAGVAPYVYCPPVVQTGGRRYLNSATCVPLKPADRAVTEADFPGLWAYFSSMFVYQKARDHFIQWLKRAYIGAHKGSPQLGQASMFVGPRDVGKTFLTNLVLSPLFGGAASAENYLTGEDKFNEDILESGLVYIDDGANATSIWALGKYTQKLKQLIANASQRCRGMFKKGTTVQWRGRLVINANDDPESLQSIPDLTVNSSDKLNLYEVQRASGYPSDADLDRELPAFARWLLDLPEDAALMGNLRFGLEAYHDESIKEKVQGAAAGMELAEAVTLYYEHQSAGGGKYVPLEGSATKLLGQLNMADGLEAALKGVTAVSLGKALRKLAARYPAKITVTNRHGSSYYTVPSL